MKIEFQVSLQGRLAIIVVACIILILTLVGAIGFALGWTAGHSMGSQTLEAPKAPKPAATPVPGAGS